MTVSDHCNDYVAAGSWISVMGICVGIGLYLMTLNLVAGAGDPRRRNVLCRAHVWVVVLVPIMSATSSSIMLSLNTFQLSFDGWRTTSASSETMTP